MPVFVDPRICEKQDICELMKVCPRNAVGYNEEGEIEVNNEKCTECLLCVKTCPYLAVKLAKDMDELGELKKNSKSVKFDRSLHIAKIYGTKPGRIGKTELEDSNFKKKVSSKTPTLVSFWGAHSGVIAPFLRQIEKKYKGRLKVAHIKLADNPKTRKKYSITTTPTLILFRNGKEIDRLEGVRYKETLRVWIDMKLKST
jgi:Fe-S-cluster-containing dehydrogenase component